MKATTKRKSGKSWKRIHVPVWDCDVFFCYGDYEWLVSNLKNIGVPDMDAFPEENKIWDASTEATTISGFCGANSVVWFKDRRPDDVLVHELAHVTFDILKRKDCPAGHDVQEPFAYLLGFLYKEALKATRKGTRHD